MDQLKPIRSNSSLRKVRRPDQFELRTKETEKGKGKEVTTEVKADTSIDMAHIGENYDINSAIEKRWEVWSKEENSRLYHFLNHIVETLHVPKDKNEQFANLTLHLFKGARDALGESTRIASTHMCQLEKIWHTSSSRWNRWSGIEVKKLEAQYIEWKESLQTSSEMNIKMFADLSGNTMLKIAGLKDERIMTSEQQVDTFKESIETFLSRGTETTESTPLLIDTVIRENPNFNTASMPELPQEVQDLLPPETREVLNDPAIRNRMSFIIDKRALKVKNSIIAELESYGEGNLTADILGDRGARNSLHKLTESMVRENTGTIKEIGDSIFSEKIDNSIAKMHRNTIDFLTNTVVLQWTGIAGFAIAIGLALHPPKHSS